MKRMYWIGTRCGMRRLLSISSGEYDAWPTGSLLPHCVAGCDETDCRSIVCMDGAGQQEDLDALPVEEQAACLASIIACDRVVGMDGPALFADMVSAKADGLLVDTYTELHDCHIDLVVDGWAEAEARIRTGMIAAVTWAVNPVEKAHPYIVVPCRCGCGRGLSGMARRHTPDEYENLDALPVEEQAAILCSISANDAHLFGPLTGPDQHESQADDLAFSAWMNTPVVDSGDCSDDVRDEWAEAEARIRTGMVRP